MKVITIFIITVPYLSTQQYYNQQQYQNLQSVPQYYQPQDYDNDYSTGHHRRSHGGKHKKHGNSGGRLPEIGGDYNDDLSVEECHCDCQSCEDPKPCCKTVCDNECTAQEQGNPTNVVFVPYPYPLMVPDRPPVVITSTPATTTTTTATTTTPTTSTKPITQAPSKERSTTCTVEDPTTPEDNIYDFRHTSDRFRQRPGFKDLTIRRLKSDWSPKYGIVPIPDHLLERLISQMIIIVTIMCLYLQISSQYSGNGHNDDHSPENFVQPSVFKNFHKSQRRFHFDYPDISTECKCTCRRCQEPGSCCNVFCNRCPAPQSLIIPYPVPFFMPVMINSAIQMTTEQPRTEGTTDKTSTTTTTPSIVSTGIVTARKAMPTIQKSSKHRFGGKILCSDSSICRPTFDLSYEIQRRSESLPKINVIHYP